MCRKYTRSNFRPVMGRAGGRKPGWASYRVAHGFQKHLNCPALSGSQVRGLLPECTIKVGTRIKPSALAASHQVARIRSLRIVTDSLGSIKRRTIVLPSRVRLRFPARPPLPDNGAPRCSQRAINHWACATWMLHKALSLLYFE